MNRALAGALALLTALLVSSCGGGGDSATPASAESAMQPRATAADPPAGLDATIFMDWAERSFPDFFPGHESNLGAAPLVFRLYPNGNALAVFGETVYLRIPQAWGSTPQALGPLLMFTCWVLPENCTTPGSVVTGTVMGKGAVLAGASVTLRDIVGVTLSTTTSASGTYSIDASFMAPPFVVTAAGTANGVSTNLVSIGRMAGGQQTKRINLTPWTTAIAAMLSPTGKAGDLDPARDHTVINGSLTVVITYSATLLAPSLADAGIALAGFDPISSALDANDSMAALLGNLTVGTTPSDAIFMASSSPCSPAQLGGCVRYSNPTTQTTTNPNVCGSDIATGAPIPCDSSLPTTSTPEPVSIDVNQAYAFGCSGCVFWGPADNYASVPTQTPIRVSVTTPTASNWYAHFSVTACAAGYCVSNGATTAITGTAYDAQASCQQAAQALAGLLSIEGVSYSFTCTQSP